MSKDEIFICEYGCPCCGHLDAWKFEYGTFEEGHRFGGSEPNEGYCTHCHFHYQEHVDHPMKEQVRIHRDSGDCVFWKDALNESCPHKKTVALNEEGHAGVYCCACGEQLEDVC